MQRDRQSPPVWSAALAHSITEPVIAVVMGVSGSGKTTVSALLAAALGCQFQEGDGWRTRHESGVLTCSALKRAYREIIIHGRPDVTLVDLRGSYDVIHRRMAARHGHFMPVVLFDSQFATLQEPTPDEHPIIVGVGVRQTEIVVEIVRHLEGRQGSGGRDVYCSSPTAGRARS